MIFTADHGDYAGEHGLMLKSGTFYDCMTRVPLIVSWPGGLESGTTRDELVSNIDIMPTVASLVGVDAPEPVYGRLMPGAGGTAREAVFAEHGGGRAACVDVGPAPIPRLHGPKPGRLLPPDARPQRRGPAENGPDGPVESTSTIPWTR